MLTHFFEWGEIRRATLSFGYGLSVTALQLAQGYAVIANGGRLPQTSFLKVSDPQLGPRVMSEETAAAVRQMLETVLGPTGTGRRARVAGYRVGGKTGTVRKSTAGGYSEDRYLALFAGMAPLSSPRLVVVVVIDEPASKEYYGGQIAAPVFSEIMDGALRLSGIAPDDESVIKRRLVVASSRDRVPAGGVKLASSPLDAGRSPTP